MAYYYPGHWSVRTLSRQGSIVNRISIGQAAKHYDVSRRTLERWIHDGRLDAIPDPKDGRQRLVESEAVERLVAMMPKHHARQEGAPTGDDTRQGFGDQPPTAEDSLESQYLQAIDDTLHLLYSQDCWLAAQLHPDAVPSLTLEQLREGALGHDLRLLAAIAQDQAYESHRDVLLTIDAVLQVLFWPAAADDYYVPRLFWDTPLGRMLTLAKFRAYRPQDLISVDEAGRLLGVTTPTLYRWMEDRTLDYVRDDTSNRTWIVRRDVDVLKGFAETFAGRRTTPPQAKAS